MQDHSLVISSGLMLSQPVHIPLLHHNLQVFPFPALLRVKIVSLTELSKTIPTFFRQSAIHGAI